MSDMLLKINCTRREQYPKKKLKLSYVSFFPLNDGFENYLTKSEYLSTELMPIELFYDEAQILYIMCMGMGIA